MKLRYTIVASLCALLALPAAGIAQNLTSNPGFETGDLTDWLVFGPGAVTVLNTDNGPSAPGSHYAFLDNQTEGTATLLKQSTADGSITEGMASYSVDLNVTETGPGGVIFVQVFAEQPNGGVLAGSGLQGPYFPSGGWITVAGSFMAPAGSDFLTIQIEAVTGAVAGSTAKVCADNIDLQGEEPVATESVTWSRIKNLVEAGL
ncbi:MAG: hypothetical protein HKN21_00705 [Candidatus Eisenbacteria bacterium]|uniref:PEP-CTERM sorting domain-containing protein n=1 Tax=Eiseniibacteriota bacterium TaxID=2212470 RepID=A0A7Y2H0S9_UNCEI|nr:hypothetical protein [Candidatus Eisenbacteria bacterium]